jgi:hypothetical protein
VSPIHLSGRRRNKGGPRVPVKGTVSDEAYKEALKLRKQFNDKQRYEKLLVTRMELSKCLQIGCLMC